MCLYRPSHLALFVTFDLWPTTKRSRPRSVLFPVKPRLPHVITWLLRKLLTRACTESLCTKSRLSYILIDVSLSVSEIYRHQFMSGKLDNLGTLELCMLNYTCSQWCLWLVHRVCEVYMKQKTDRVCKHGLCSPNHSLLWFQYVAKIILSQRSACPKVYMHLLWCKLSLLYS